jgi:hypothetical protein
VRFIWLRTKGQEGSELEEQGAELQPRKEKKGTMGGENYRMLMPWSVELGGHGIDDWLDGDPRPPTTKLK